jgi:signal transduction histidine kinase
VITVADDGRGFIMSEVDCGPGDEGGFGLFSIRERMVELHGSLETDSAPDEAALRD